MIYAKKTVTQSDLKRMIQTHGNSLNANNCKSIANKLKPKTEAKIPTGSQVKIQMNNNYVVTKGERWDVQVFGDENLTIPTAPTLAEACFMINQFDASKSTSK